MLELIAHTFMQRALLAGTLVGILCAVVGVYVVLNGLSFMGAGIGHASFGGVALGILLGVNPLLTAVVFCLGTAWGVGLVARKTSLREDAAVGVFFACTMALGILFLGLMPGYGVDLFGYLFGSILAVTRQDLWLALLLAPSVLAAVALFYKELLFVSFDPEMARVAGLPVDRLHSLLLVLVALTVVGAIKIVGIVLVSALIVAPAAAARQLTEDFHRMMILAPSIGAASTAAGLLLSCWLDTASGATIVLVATAAFALAAALRRGILPTG
jgi:ABC-type Mn2+/Zn2+ transport system permease subunit